MSFFPPDAATGFSAGLNLAEVGWLASAAAFTLSMSATPGPNNAMVAASGATFGFRRTVPHMLGVAIGFPVMVLAIALGAGTVLRDYPWIHKVMKGVGAAYLLWLAWKIATARPAAKVEGAVTSGRPFSFLQAALFQWVNPKGWVAAISAVAAYTTATGSVMGQAAALALLFAVVGFPCVALWTGIGAGAARILRSDEALRRFNWVMAAMLTASLVAMLAEG